MNQPDASPPEPEDAPAPAPEGFAVEIEGLTKTFRTAWRRRPLVAVDDLSLRVVPGEVYGLIGPNGSGKSTTMKVLLGLLAPTRGRSAIFGRDSREVGSRREVGFLPENPYFYKHLTGEETLAFYGRLCGLRRHALRGRIDELLALVGLEGARDRRLGGYSKGMLQRIGLAAALVQEPRLVVLDEPTAGVDPAGSRRIRDLVLELKGRGITVILCSHLLEQVQEVCDRVGILAGGRLVREGALHDLIAIEDQTEILVRNANPAFLEGVRQLLESAEAAGTELVRIGHPRTTLERLFLQETAAAAAPATDDDRTDDHGA